ncbi:gamma-glutamyltransferase [Aliiglaciecola sp. CAU 1673]|uniref:gamma-glutamyltransferase n=1 Tax=Aliiglaciecola sp. CAU 1673 TaxID=3032595 RepID=UPI0023DA4D31|nr:gamma-glutamyltransferase [Aliiglaciecola sp. CAU 1673]MDF2177888.1 gamma-glutamyltransferase [Aliiglaciecola sp. CAU 1673]
MSRLLVLFISICWSFSVVAGQAAVAMPDSYSAKAAAKVLEEGGNAVDASITAGFVLAVTLPEAGNLGGGGFMLFYQNNKTDFLDYREKAPQKAHRDMYLDDKGEVQTEKPLYGILASGVPGSVMGLWQAHQKYGSLPWERLVQPAIELAENGFIPHKKLQAYVQEYLDEIEAAPHGRNFAKYFAALTGGQRFKQPELAATLTRIAKQGPKDFYEGETADKLVSFMQHHGGLISKEDLKQYQAQWRTPLQKSWRSYEVVSAPPPSSGGLVLLQMLAMLSDKIDCLEDVAHNSTRYVHLLAELAKPAFADRAEYMGDPDFYPVPVQKLLDDAYLAERAKLINPIKISETEAIKPGLQESENTTHYSVVDKWGNAVATTTTLNLSFGSGMVVEGAGFLLNDEMDDFSAKPGVPNYFGAVGKDANAIAPGKRMLSSMTPTLLIKNGQVQMVTGSPGGTTIISSVYQSILNRVLFNMDAQSLVDAPRVHHQLLPKNTIRHHPKLDKTVQDGLVKMGYTLDARRFGDLQVIVRDADGALAAASESSGRGLSMVVETK